MHPVARQVALGAVAFIGTALAQSQQPGLDLGRYPARDSHQGVTIAAVPVPDTPEAEAIFGKNAAPTRGGFLPVEIILLNERADTIRVNLARIGVLEEGDAFEQVGPETVARALYPPPGLEEPKVGGGPRLPVPWPRGSKTPKDKKKEAREEAAAALRSRQLRAGRVAPGGSARGYLYFDLRGKTIELESSSLYIPEVEVVGAGERLLFFEISLAAYARPAP